MICLLLHVGCLKKLFTMSYIESLKISKPKSRRFEFMVLLTISGILLQECQLLEECYKTYYNISSIFFCFIKKYLTPIPCKK